jgi:hypothetical protein
MAQILQKSIQSDGRISNLYNVMVISVKIYLKYNSNKFSKARKGHLAPHPMSSTVHI